LIGKVDRERLVLEGVPVARVQRAADEAVVVVSQPSGIAMCFGAMSKPLRSLVPMRTSGATV
jgi:hypothetical protein